MDIKPYCFVFIGLPGSGKSTLASEFSETFNAPICSADFFHMKDGKYNWKPENVGKAHEACKFMFQKCINNEESVIVDNTNVKPSDYIYYIDTAEEAGYQIFFVEPNTPWCMDVNECYIRNTHGVPLATLEKMYNSLLYTKTLPSKYKRINSIEQVMEI